MNWSSALAFATSSFCIALAIAVLIRKRVSIVSGCFSAGMLLFGLESVFTGLSFEAAFAEQVAFWQTLALVTKSLLPGTWLCFSLTYSRGNYREFLARWRFLLIAAFLLPVFLLPALQAPFTNVQLTTEDWWLEFSQAAKILNALILVSSIMVLMNLERTLRAFDRLHVDGDRLFPE